MQMPADREWIEGRFSRSCFDTLAAHRCHKIPPNTQEQGPVKRYSVTKMPPGYKRRLLSAWSGKYPEKCDKFLRSRFHGGEMPRRCVLLNGKQNKKIICNSRIKTFHQKWMKRRLWSVARLNHWWRCSRFYKRETKWNIWHIIIESLNRWWLSS